ncbi:unnamed protein product, partial [Allacma fusca]
SDFKSRHVQLPLEPAQNHIVHFTNFICYDHLKDFWQKWETIAAIVQEYLTETGQIIPGAMP